ncbi:hypothetical protein IG631_16746 [Alternaria alternata]|nr:hypothetical protein IG631_16746 [Alternaria alternata]
MPGLNLLYPPQITPYSTQKNLFFARLREQSDSKPDGLILWNLERDHTFFSHEIAKRDKFPLLTQRRPTWPVPFLGAALVLALTTRVPYQRVRVLRRDDLCARYLLPRDEASRSRHSTLLELMVRLASVNLVRLIDARDGYIRRGRRLK